MNKLQFFVGLCLITLFAACTTQVETNLQEPETLNVTTDDEREVVLRSTQQECDDIEGNLPMNPSGSQLAELLECRLNQGVDEDDVQANCPFSESYSYTACHYENDIKNNYSTLVDGHKQRVVANTNPCPGGCVSPDPYPGCRTIIFSVTFLNDDDCPGAPDEWKYSVVAYVYCCG